MKLIRNLLIVLILSALVCSGVVLFYYSNEYPYSFTGISVNEPVGYSEDNKELADIFKRVMKVSEEEADLSEISFHEPELHVTTHINGRNQRYYDIYLTSVMTRSAYIHDRKTDTLYKMSPSAFVVFFGRDEIAPFAYEFAEPCEMTLSSSEFTATAKASVSDWNYIIADGSYVKVTEVEGSGEVSGFVMNGSEDFKVSLPYTPSSLKARVYTSDNETVFDGVVNDGILPCVKQDGILHYEVTAVWNVDVTKDFYGTAKYIFAIENDVPVSVNAEKVSCYQGEFLRLFAKNVNDTDVFSVSCPDLRYESSFSATPNGVISLMPIPCDAVPGIYSLNVSENGQTRTIEIEVKEQSFEKGTVTISTETSPEAEAELEAILEPFRTYVSEYTYTGGVFTAPVEGKITTSFGLHGYTDGGDTFTIHNGQDIAAKGNPDIKASKDGKVVYVGQLQVPGNTVIIDHGLNILSYYYHMKSTHVEVGQIVSQDEKIGVMGKTGYSTGDHLHYTVMINGIATNPVTLYDVDPSGEEIK